MPRAASAAVAAGVVVNALGDAATPEIVAGLIACRTEQILPAIEDYLFSQKGLARGDVDSGAGLTQGKITKGSAQILNTTTPGSRRSGCARIRTARAKIGDI